MVSAQYLAQYQANQANRSSAPPRRSANREVDQVWIERWGGGSYLAEWRYLRNQGAIHHKRAELNDDLAEFTEGRVMPQPQRPVLRCRQAFLTHDAILLSLSRCEVFLARTITMNKES